MIRLLLWIFLAVIVVNVVKLFRIGVHIRDEARHNEDVEPIPPFDSIQDADFEDITPDPPPAENDPKHE